MNNLTFEELVQANLQVKKVLSATDPAQELSSIYNEMILKINVTTKSVEERLPIFVNDESILTEGLKTFNDNWSGLEEPSIHEKFSDELEKIKENNQYIESVLTYLSALQSEINIALAVFNEFSKMEEFERDATKYEKIMDMYEPLVQSCKGFINIIKMNNVSILRSFNVTV